MDRNQIIEKIKTHTLISMKSGKLEVLLDMSELTKNVKGCVVEVGVYRGGTAKLFALSNPNRQIHLFDTFQGIPYDSGSLDIHYRGQFAADENDVRMFLLECKNIHFYPGIFPDTWPVEGLGPIAIAHCDVDMQKSAEDFINVIWPNMAVNGLMIFDDYNAPACPGVKLAVDNFMKKEGNEGIEPLALHSTQCIIKKYDERLYVSKIEGEE